MLYIKAWEQEPNVPWCLKNSKQNERTQCVLTYHHFRVSDSFPLRLGVFFFPKPMWLARKFTLNFNEKFAYNKNCLKGTGVLNKLEQRVVWAFFFSFSSHPFPWSWWLLINAKRWRTSYWLWLSTYEMPANFSIKWICLEFLLEPVQGLGDGPISWKGHPEDFSKNLLSKKIL